MTDWAERGRAVDELAIQRLVARFSWAIDREGGSTAFDLLTEDAVLYLPDPDDGWRPTQELRGRATILARWQGRSPLVVTRHLTLNLEILRLDPGQAHVRSVGLGFRHEGPGPGIPAPVVVADYDDVCVRGSDGQWRFSERRITPLFVDLERLPK